MCETWLSGNAVEVPADADVFAHVTCLRCESCSLPVVDERKLKHLSAVACFKKPGENVFRCDVCANAGPRSQRSRRAFSPRSPRSSRRHRREIDNTNDDLIEFDDQLISPRSRRRHRHSTARAREPREGDVGMMTATFESSEEDMLTYFMGDFVTILACPSGAPMWRGRLDDGFEGLFRASHITVLGSRNSAQVRRARRQARGLGGISLSDILKTDPDDVKDDDDYIDDDVRSNEEDRRSRSGGFFDRLSLRGSAGKKPAAAAAAASKAGAASAAASAKAPIESEQQLSFLDMLQEEPPKDMLEKRATMNRSLREKVAANKNPDNEVVSLLDILGEEPPPKTPRKPIEIVSLSDILAEGPPPGMMVSPRKSIVVRKSADVKTAATTSAAAAAAAAATAEDDAESAEQSSSYSYSGSYTDSYVSEEPADEATTKRAGTAGGPPVEMSAEERKKAVRAAAQRAAAAASAPVAATTDARPRVTGKAAKLLGLEGGAGAARSNGAAGAATSSTTTAVAEVTTSAEKKKDDEVVSWADMLSEEPPPKSGK
jgi:hypothetical protein